VVPSASDHHLCLADLNSFDEPTAPTGPATSIGSKLTQQSGLGKVYLESGSALEAYLIRGHSGGGRPVCGWSHAMEERIVGVVATAYGLKIAELIGLRSRAYVEVRDQIVQTLMDQKLKDGGWTAVSGKRVSRPEATAWVLMALFRSGAYSEAKECTHTLERMFDPPVAHHRVLTLTLALRALAEIKPESPVIPPLVRQLLDSAARDEEGRIKFWGNLCFTAPITDWKQAGRPSAVHTAHSIVALLLTHNCTSGRSGAEASQFAVACDWLLSQVSWKDDEEKIQRPLGDEIDALRVAHYTTPWVIEALLRVGVDPTHPRIQESVRQLLASQNAGLWDWQSIRKPIWATYDALVALTDYSNRRSLVWPE